MHPLVAATFTQYSTGPQTFASWYPYTDQSAVISERVQPAGEQGEFGIGAGSMLRLMRPGGAHSPLAQAERLEPVRGNVQLAPARHQTGAHGMAQDVTGLGSADRHREGGPASLDAKRL